jgi:hypothetical protein
VKENRIEITAGPGALHWVAESISNLQPDPNEEDAATQSARDLAFNLLRDASERVAYSIAPTAVEQIEKDLLIRWEFQNKGLILVCPGEANEPTRIYRETVRHNRAEHTEFVAQAAVDDLVGSMRWLIC